MESVFTMRAKLRGFTLIEVLVVLAIIAIVAAMAAPNFYQYIKDKQLTTSASGAYQLFNYARSEALSRGERIYLMPRKNQDWATGVMVLRDGGDRVCSRCSNDSDLGDDAILQELTFQGSLQVNASASSAVFNGAGALATNFDMTFCDDRSDEVGRLVRVLASGFMAVSEKGDC